MNFFKTLMEEQPQAPHQEPPKMPNFFEVDKKKVIF